MTSSRGTLRRTFRGARRRVLAHRRLLAGVFVLLAVVLGLQAARPEPPAAASMVVASHDLPAGAVLTASDLTAISVPPDAIPAGAQPQPSGRILASGLRRGEPVTDLRLVGPSLTEGHPGTVAVPVRLPDADMARLLRVGDDIRLLATDTQGGETTTVAPDALVLALPASGDESASDSAASLSGSSGASGLTSALGGRLVVIGVPDRLVTTVATAAVRDFLSYAYPTRVEQFSHSGISHH